MLSDFTGAAHVYIACGYTDIRKGIDGLSLMIQQQGRLDPCSDALFLFCGRKRNRIKALYWEEDGFVLLYKRLENRKYQWSRNSKEVQELTAQQYRWHMEGSSVEPPKAHRKVDGLEFGQVLKNADIASKIWYNGFMKNENKTVPETQKTVTISIEEYEALQELEAENARLNQQIQ